MAFPEELTKLHTTLVNVQKGYEEAVEDASTASLKDFFGQMLSFHKRNADDVKSLLFNNDVAVVDDAPSLMAAVHRAVVRVRSVIVNLDESELKPFIDGERQILSHYDEAISEAGARSPIEWALQRQKKELETRVSEMQAKYNLAQKP